LPTVKSPREFAEFERELARVAADPRIEHLDRQRVGGIAKHVALADQPEPGLGRFADDRRTIDPVERFGVAGTTAGSSRMIDDDEQAAWLEQTIRVSGKRERARAAHELVGGIVV